MITEKESARKRTVQREYLKQAAAIIRAERQVRICEAGRLADNEQS